MVSIRKSKFKKVSLTIIIVILAFSAISLFATKLIYDGIFSRYDCSITEYPKELADTVSLREKLSYASGENTLSGYLYRSQTSNKKDALIILAHGHNSCSDN